MVPNANAHRACCSKRQTLFPRGTFWLFHSSPVPYSPTQHSLPPLPKSIPFGAGLRFLWAADGPGAGAGSAARSSERPVLSCLRSQLAEPPLASPTLVKPRPRDATRSPVRSASSDLARRSRGAHRRAMATLGLRPGWVRVEKIPPVSTETFRIEYYVKNEHVRTLLGGLGRPVCHACSNAVRMGSRARLPRPEMSSEPFGQRTAAL